MGIAVLSLGVARCGGGDSSIEDVVDAADVQGEGVVEADVDLSDVADGDADADLDADADGDADDDALPDVTTDVVICPAGMISVPSSPFWMGSDLNEGTSDERPEHEVTLDGYCIDANEVTNLEYRACEAADGCTTPVGGIDSHTRTGYHTDPTYDNYAVIYIDWNQASAYCAWAGKRLPTEAEWEKAARGGCEVVAPATCGTEDERTYPWGEDTPTCSLVNYYSGCIGDTDAVGVRIAGDSPYGVHDMAGNVWEWVADWYDGTYYSTCASGCTNPTGPSSGTYRVMRGGSWGNAMGGLRTATRGRTNPEDGHEAVGVRCAKTP